MMDRDRFSDEYDPEPDYDRPTRAEAEAEAADGEPWFGRMWQEMTPADDEALADEFADQAAGLRAHLTNVHGVPTADLDDFVLTAVHAEVHGWEPDQPDQESA